MTTLQEYAQNANGFLGLFWYQEYANLSPSQTIQSIIVTKKQGTSAMKKTIIPFCCFAFSVLIARPIWATSQHAAEDDDLFIQIDRVLDTIDRDVLGALQASAGAKKEAEKKMMALAIASHELDKTKATINAIEPQSDSLEDDIYQILPPSFDTIMAATHQHETGPIPLFFGLRGFGNYGAIRRFFYPEGHPGVPLILDAADVSADDLKGYIDQPDFGDLETFQAFFIKDGDHYNYIFNLLAQEIFQHTPLGHTEKGQAEDPAAVITIGVQNHRASDVTAALHGLLNYWFHIDVSLYQALHVANIKAEINDHKNALQEQKSFLEKMRQIIQDLSNRENARQACQALESKVETFFRHMRLNKELLQEAPSKPYTQSWQDVRSGKVGIYAFFNLAGQEKEEAYYRKTFLNNAPFLQALRTKIEPDVIAYNTDHPDKTVQVDDAIQAIILRDLVTLSDNGQRRILFSSPSSSSS